LSTINPIGSPEANQGRRGGKPASNRLSYGTANIELNTQRNILSKIQGWQYHFRSNLITARLPVGSPVTYLNNGDRETSAIITDEFIY
jgi:hypothetical protein